MIELDAENVLDYLRNCGRLPADEPAHAAELAWGVSNIVLRISPANGQDFVLKQSRAQLRTDHPWFSSIERIWREMQVMQLLGEFLPQHAVPHVLFSDPDNYCFAMQAVQADHIVWKQALLEGNIDPQIARLSGEYLAVVHRETLERADLQRAFGDSTVFVELRIDPFYRRLAEVHPDMKQQLEKLVEQTLSTRLCLVLGDFSPKNILVTDNGITLVDFETGHIGDPAFDLGFFLSHLLLKAIVHAKRFDDYATLTTTFWQQYTTGLPNSKTLDQNDLMRRTISHLAACMWSRVDATSPVDYLTEEPHKELVRRFARSLLHDPPTQWTHVLAQLKIEVAALD